MELSYDITGVPARGIVSRHDTRGTALLSIGTILGCIAAP
jgi:hypothetical protein